MIRSTGPSRMPIESGPAKAPGVRPFAPRRAVQPRLRLAAGRPIRRLGDGSDRPSRSSAASRCSAGSPPTGRPFAATTISSGSANVRTTETVQFGFLKLRRSDRRDASRRPADRSARSCPRTSSRIPATRSSVANRITGSSQTATGKLFAFGVLIATIVASAVVYQVLSNDVRDHLAEYATLKAMGHTNGYLSRVVVQQALIYSVVAYVIAVAFGFGLYRATEALAGIPMRITPEILGLTLLVTAIMGLVSAVFTLDKVWRADPADLF